jgi:hypothetical protein
MPWITEFRNRMGRLAATLPPLRGEIPISIKVRVDSGCYSRGCCPFAFGIIDNRVHILQRKRERFIFEEHETGPELLVYLAVTAAGLGLAKSVVELVTAIIKARSDGRKHGDRHDEPITLVVRHLQEGETFAEERLLTIQPNDQIASSMVGTLLLDGCRKLVPKGKPKNAKRAKPKNSRRQRK